MDENRDRFGVEPICRELEVSASAYRARRTRPPSDRALRDAFLLEEIRRVHEGNSGVYGQFKVWDELNDTGTRVAQLHHRAPDAQVRHRRRGPGEDGEDDPARRAAGGRP